MEARKLKIVTILKKELLISILMLVIIVISSCSRPTPTSTPSSPNVTGVGGIEMTPPVPVGKNIKAPLGLPARGYTGLRHLEAYQSNQEIHLGVDFWATRRLGTVWSDEANQRGNPVFAVGNGKLGRTKGGVYICHAPLDTATWSNLPDLSVCTFYYNLKDMPDQINRLKVDACPKNLVDVKRGDVLGYMDYDPKMDAVLVRFVVVKQVKGCPADPTKAENTYDPFLYMGLDGENFDWLVEFP